MSSEWFGRKADSCEIRREELYDVCSSSGEGDDKNIWREGMPGEGENKCILGE